MSFTRFPLLLAGTLALSIHAEAAVSEARLEAPQLVNQGESGIAFVWIGSEGRHFPPDLLDADETLAAGKSLTLDLPPRGTAALWLIGSDGFVTEAAGIRLRDLTMITVSNGRIELLYGAGATRVPVQSIRYGSEIACLENGVKDAGCVEERRKRWTSPAWAGFQAWYW